jgi:hypothetical protein
MKPPRIHPLLADVVQTALQACNGILFDTLSACPACGGKLSGYDRKKKQFVIMHDQGKRIPVHVLVKRFSCRECGTVCFAEEPFYPATRAGSPIVDLCVTLSATMPFSRAAVYLEHLGILIDRGTVRHYARSAYPGIPTTDLFGIRLPLSIVSLSELATRFGEGGRIPGTEVLVACGFPSAYRTAPDRLLPPEQGNERKKEENKEKRHAQNPEYSGNYERSDE